MLSQEGFIQSAFIDQFLPEHISVNCTHAMVLVHLIHFP